MKGLMRSGCQIQNHSDNNPVKYSLFWVFVLWCLVSSFGRLNKKSKRGVHTVLQYSS